MLYLYFTHLYFTHSFYSDFLVSCPRWNRLILRTVILVTQHQLPAVNIVDRNECGRLTGNKQKIAREQDVSLRP